MKDGVAICDVLVYMSIDGIPKDFLIFPSERRFKDIWFCERKYE
jgi:hypothetical protein